MTEETQRAAEEAVDALFHRPHCHHDPHAVAVLAKFPTATAVSNRQDVAAGQPEFWWVINDTGAVLSEPGPVYYPTEQDAWDAAYLISVRGVTVEQIRVEAFLLWELTGRPEGAALENWLDAKGDLETPPSAPPPPPTE
jgi:hypothetical protein